MKKIKIKTGDNIKVIAGDHKGSEGKVIKIFKANNTALIEGVNLDIKLLMERKKDSDLNLTK